MFRGCIVPPRFLPSLRRSPTRTSLFALCLVACTSLPGGLAAEIVGLEAVGSWTGDIRYAAAYETSVYVLNGDGTVLRALDATDPAGITDLDSLALGGSYDGVLVGESGGERWGYVNGPVAPVTVRLTDPHAMSVWHQWPAGLQILAVESDILYGRTGNDFIVYDVSVPGTPVELSHTTIGAGIETWTRAGSLFYFMGTTGTCEDLYHEQYSVSGIDRIDATDPVSPSRTWFHSCGGFCDDACNIGTGILLAADNWVQIGYGPGAWYHLNSIAPWTPEFVALPYPWMYRFNRVDGNDIFWLASGVLYVYNAANPYQPVELASAPIGVSRFSKSDDRIYAWSSGGLDVWQLVECPPRGASEWIAQSSGTTRSLYGVSFVDDLTGIAVGETGTIRHTADGGQTWDSRTSGTTQHLMDVCLSGALTGTAVGFGGTVLRTENGGDTWTPQNSGTTRSLYDVCFTGPLTGTIVGSTGTILRTTDGGVNWTPRTTGSTTSLFGVFFRDSLSGYAVGNLGKIFRTGDGGYTWDVQSSGTTVQLRSVFFCNDLTGYAAGENGEILATGDGGTNWSSQSTPTASWLGAVSFADAATGIAAGGDGVLLRTGNGGVSWACESGGVSTDVNAVCFIDAETAVAVGDGGTIIRWEYDPLTPVWISGFTASAGENSVRLDWSVDADETIEGFRIYRSTPAGQSAVLLTDPPLPGTQRTYRDDDVQPAETYRYTLGVLSARSGEIRSSTVEAQIPAAAARLFQNRPNPFNPVTTIRYSIPRTSHVELSVYTAAGQLVRQLVNGIQSAGVRETVWDGVDEAGNRAVSGIYFYRLRANGFSYSKKMVLLK